MSKTDAAYMKAYRARKKAIATTKAVIETVYDVSKAEQRIAQLEAEVKHLKAELAKRTDPLGLGPAAERFSHRPDGSVFDARQGFNTRPFTPAPKGK